jgi:undecaprenyl-diphosphatase
MSSLIQSLLRFNESLFLAINRPAGYTPLTDALMPIFANDLLYLFPLFLVILWWTTTGKTVTASSERSISREAVLWAVVAVLLALAINVTLGALIPEPRPFATQHIQMLIAHSKDASFPSDHDAITFAIAVVLLLRLWLAYRIPARVPAQFGKTNEANFSDATRSTVRLITGLLALWGGFFAVATGYARIYVGVHYPLDILGGAAIGLLSAWLVFLARPLLRPIARLVERGAQAIRLA